MQTICLQRSLATGDTVILKRDIFETELTIFSPRVSATVAALTLLATLCPAEAADQRYEVAGVDTYQVGTTVASTQIAYAGTQQLNIETDSGGTRFSADVRYTRTDESGKASAEAKFVQIMTNAGTFEDRTDNDPDFLTILNQPFAIELDPTTMQDLRTLQGPIPFQASSPLGDSTLHGFLRPAGTGGRVGGRPVIGVRFEADGPMTGSLPERTDTVITGTIRMDGTAYYAADSALLYALDATLTINGQLVDHQKQVPVHIVYRRTIRADSTADALSQVQH